MARRATAIKCRLLAFACGFQGTLLLVHEDETALLSSANGGRLQCVGEQKKKQGKRKEEERDAGCNAQTKKEKRRACGAKISTAAYTHTAAANGARSSRKQ